VRIEGSESTLSERLIAFEAGTRWQLDSTKWIDVATFYNIYDRLIGVVPGTSSLVLTPTPHLVVPSTVSNVGEAASYGVEFYGRWQATDNLLLSGGYTFFEGNSEAIDGNSPEHQVRLSASAELDERTALDVTLRYVDELPALNIDPYTVFDVRVAHKLSDSSSVALIGRNLFSSHFEFGNDGTLLTNPTRVEQSFFLVFEKKL
jgi:iron complex outermembrane receptor protein